MTETIFEYEDEGGNHSIDVEVAPGGVIISAWDSANPPMSVVYLPREAVVMLVQSLTLNLGTLDSPSPSTTPTGE